LLICKDLRTIANSCFATRNNTIISGLFVSRSNLIIENLALRQQLTVQQRTIKRPKLKRQDRLFWAWLSQTWPDWKSTLIVVKPEGQGLAYIVSGAQKAVFSG